MTTPRLYNTEVVVLRKAELGEADSILTLYTPYLGKLRAVAKGVRRPKSRLGGHAELLTHSEMSLVQSQNLDIVTQSQTIESFLPLRDDLWRTSSAIYVVELVDRFTAEGEENHPLFRLLVDTLRWLCRARHGELIVRCFELRLFACLGYEPQLQQCVGCRSPLKPDINFFTPSGGGVLCPRCRNQEPVVYPLSVSGLKVLRFLQRSGYASVDRLRITPELSSELKQLMRSYVRYLLEREVRSAEWLDRLEEEGFSSRSTKHL
ncbi:MAG: DNA repair protein RecO [Dehalococcoidia bacterium]|jgi:DNA repair protein RecO (recombination protein O)|nr:MAG: DNA repair protein RecO [Dehalococcoidia bacterium]